MCTQNSPRALTDQVQRLGGPGAQVPDVRVDDLARQVLLHQACKAGGGSDTQC